MPIIASIIIGFIFFITSSMSFAAKDGDLSLDLGSTGKKTITINVKKKIKISGLEDVEFGDWKIGDGDQINENQICIYSNSASGYQVIANSTNSDVDGEFAMTSDTDTKIKYELKWYDNTANSLTPEGILLTEGSATTEFFNAERYSVDCASGKNSKLELKIASSDLEQVQGSETEYSDTLTLTVSPK